MEIGHYLSALERKPHAVTHASVVRRLPSVFGKVRERMVAAHRSGYKDFLAILLLLREHSLSDVAAALETMNVADVTAAALRLRLSPIGVTIMDTAEVVTTTAHAAQYDQLLQEVS